MISSITNRGKLRFMVYEQNMDASVFITFLERLIESSQKKVFLILDNLRIHHAKLVKAWVEEHQAKIALFYLPAYSPDLNPDEYLNNDFKRNVNAKHIPINKKELTKNTEDFMNMLSLDSQRVYMLPIFQTSKTTFLISPHYDAFCNSFSPFGAKLLVA
jgi:transposase